MLAVPFADQPGAVEKLEPLVASLLSKIERLHPNLARRPDNLGRNIMHLVEIGRSGADAEVHQRMAQFINDIHVSRRAFVRDESRRRVAFFGGSRSVPDAHDPLAGEHAMVRASAQLVDSYGYTVMHGAGPGIDRAAHDGARDGSGAFGLTIQEPNSPRQKEIDGHGDRRVVLVTPEARKHAMAFHADAYAFAPGGFGTLDKLFGILTAQQCGTVPPKYVALLEPPGGDYWKIERSEMWRQMAGSKTISPHDTYLVEVVHSPDELAAGIAKFYSNFHSLRIGKPSPDWTTLNKSYVSFYVNALPMPKDILRLNRELEQFVGNQPFRAEPYRPGHPYEISVHLGVKGESHFREMIDCINQLDGARALQRLYNLDTDFDLQISTAADRNAFLDRSLKTRSRFSSGPLTPSILNGVDEIAKQFVADIESMLGSVDAPLMLAGNIAGSARAFLEGATEEQERSVALLAWELSEAQKVRNQVDTQRGMTVFGSARTRPGDPSYDQAVELTRKAHEFGYLIINGGGPGQMEAAAWGAKENAGAIDIMITLPNEPDSKKEPAARHFVRFLDFTTRKIGLILPSSAFMTTKGGFGTLDELYEVLVESRYAKARPIVLLDVPGDDFWATQVKVWERNIFESGRADPELRDLFLLTSDPDEALRYVSNFYRNYRDMSIKRSGPSRTVTVDLNAPLTKSDLATLQEKVPEILSPGKDFEYGGPISRRRGIWKGDRLRFVTNDDLMKYMPRLIKALNELPGIERFEQLEQIADDDHALAKMRARTEPFNHMALEAVLDANPDALLAGVGTGGPTDVGLSL